MMTLSYLRDHRRVSAAMAAKKLGVSEAEYLRLERRPYEFTVRQAMELAKLLQTDMASIDWHWGLHKKQSDVSIARVIRLWKLR